MKRPFRIVFSFLVFFSLASILTISGCSIPMAGEGVKVIVLIDRCDGHTTADGNWEGTRLYEIEADNDLNAIKSTRLADSTHLNLTDTGDIDELNMGDPATVTAFINYCEANYSADHYALIFWNHGGGWRDKIIKKGGGFSFTPRYLGSSKEKIPKEPINKWVWLRLPTSS